MLNGVLIGVLILALTGAIWQLLRARRQVREMRHQLTQLHHDLDRKESQLTIVGAWQASIGAAVTLSLITLDAEGRVTWANPTARDLFGDVIGKTLIEASRSHELDSLANDAMRSADPLDRGVTLNGQPFAARVVPLSTGGLALTLQDMSELQRLGRVRRDFVANISHELRTPLASIRLLVDTLQAGALFNPPIANDMLSKINAEVDALSQLAQELLDLAMIESGQMPLRLSSTDLSDLAQTQVERFEPQAQQKQLTLHLNVPRGVYALADAEMINRVLSNLLHNALKFTPPGGQISMSVQREGDNVVVSVTDTGPGIPREELSRIFERFYKVDRARGQSGTGLGLAVARHIVEGHGGRIWAESEPGHGATFRFTLPMC